MEFNTGDFIFHPSLGVGRIQEHASIHDPSQNGNGNEFFVRFQNGESRTMTQELLERGAQKVSPEGFHAYAYMDEGKAKELLASNPVEVITMVLQDFPGFVAKNEDFKEYLAPYLQDWAEWWEKAQPKLKESPLIDTSRSKVREYGLRSDSLSRAEELYRSFRRMKYLGGDIAYEQARRTLTEYRNRSTLEEEQLEDVLSYLKQFSEAESSEPGLRLDAVFRLQEGRWLEEEQVAQSISRIFTSGVRLYQLDLFSLNRTVDYLLSQPLTKDRENLLASAICSVEPVIRAITAWALQRGDSGFIARLLTTALSEHIPPQMEKESLDDLAVRLDQLRSLVKGLEIENEHWPVIISRFENLVSAVSGLDDKLISLLYSPSLEFSHTLYKRFEPRRPELAVKVLDCLLAPDLPKQFILKILDTALRLKHLTPFRDLLEQQLWSEGEDRNFDFLRELMQSKGSTVEQVKALLEAANRYDSPTLNAHVGEVICELVKKDETTDRILFLPYLNQLHAWGGQWNWSTTAAGLRESIYLDALERSRGDFGDTALKNAVLRFVRLKTQELDDNVEQLHEQLQQADEKISQFEALLSEREQVLRELRSGYGGDTAEARFSERVRVVKEVAASLAEFERMEAKMENKSREVQAMIRRLESILAGLNITAMEPVGSQVTFSPQKHHVVDTTPIEIGETVTVVERGYLIRDLKERLRLLKPALVRK